MRAYHRVLLAVLLSVGLAGALSVVPKLDRSVRPFAAEQPVFRADQSLALTDANLVDVFARYPLRLSLSRVEWSESVLSVDLRLKPGEATEHIYNDLYELARLGFAGTTNVSQMLVRVMDVSDNAEPELLLAMDASRDDVTEGAAVRSRDESKGSKEQFLSDHFHLIYTHRWLERQRH